VCNCADIEWPEDDEALSDSARSTIEALLSSDPQARPNAVGKEIFLNCVCVCVFVSVCYDQCFTALMLLLGRQ